MSTLKSNIHQYAIPSGVKDIPPNILKSVLEFVLWTWWTSSIVNLAKLQGSAFGSIATVNANAPVCINVSCTAVYESNVIRACTTISNFLASIHCLSISVYVRFGHVSAPKNREVHTQHCPT